MARIWEVDTARGFAVLLMVVFNWSFALDFLGIAAMPSGALYQFFFPRFIGASFITIAGLSLVLSARTGRAPEKFVYRGLKIFAAGLAITAATWFLFPESYVYFGILHLIGAATLLAFPFINRPSAALLASVAIFAATPFLLDLQASDVFGSALGTKPYQATLDYFPLFPWLGFMLLGVWLGHKLYAKSKTVTGIKEIHQLTWLGRRSLLIYLLHQPVLGLLLIALGYRIL